jgi:hypothetical protein
MKVRERVARPDAAYSASFSLAASAVGPVTLLFFWLHLLALDPIRSFTFLKAFIWLANTFGSIAFSRQNAEMKRNCSIENV